MSPSPEDGPSLATYVETRLNLLTEAIKEKTASQDEVARLALEASHAALIAMREFMAAAMAAADIRYQQRFEAQSDALAAAFQSQQQAMQTAFTVAEKAVQAALAAADRAVAKAEAAADKRFEALNELRQMLNDMMTNLMPRIEAEQRFKDTVEKIEATNKQIEILNGRANIATGEQSGNRRTRDDSKSLIAVAVALVSVVLALWTFFAQ